MKLRDVFSDKRSSLALPNKLIHNTFPKPFWMCIMELSGTTELSNSNKFTEFPLTDLWHNLWFSYFCLPLNPQQPHCTFYRGLGNLPVLVPIIFLGKLNTFIRTLSSSLHSNYWKGIDPKIYYNILIIMIITIILLIIINNRCKC